MEPENGGPLEKEIPIGNHHFSGFMLNFRSVGGNLIKNFLLKLPAPGQDTHELHPFVSVDLRMD